MMTLLCYLFQINVTYYNGLDNRRSKYLGPYMNGATGYVLSKNALETIKNYYYNFEHLKRRL